MTKTYAEMDTKVVMINGCVGWDLNSDRTSLFSEPFKQILSVGSKFVEQLSSYLLFLGGRVKLDGPRSTSTQTRKAAATTKELWAYVRILHLEGPSAVLFCIARLPCQCTRWACTAISQLPVQRTLSASKPESFSN